MDNINLNLQQGLTYDDLLLRPRYSEIESRKDPDISSTLVGDISIQSPILSAPMDTVTESSLAREVSDAGGAGVVHRHFKDNKIQSQVEEVSKVKGLVGGSVGIGSDSIDRSQRLASAGCDFLCVDVAHAHTKMCSETVKEISEGTDVPLIAGNVSTSEGAIQLVDAGADAVKIGIGPGSHCLTREVAGVGVPQVTAIREVTKGLQKARTKGVLDKDYVPVIADGGIQSSGDISKALCLGADSVMIGGLFGGCEESPAQTVTKTETNRFGEEQEKVYKRTRGMSSNEARDDNEMENSQIAEGDSGLVPLKGTVENLMNKLNSGVRVSFSYIGADNIRQARKRSAFVKTSESVKRRNGTHGVLDKN